MESQFSYVYESISYVFNKNRPQLATNRFGAAFPDWFLNVPPAGKEGRFFCVCFRVVL